MQIDVDNKRESSTAITIFTVIAVLLIFGLPIYSYFKLKPSNLFNQEVDREESEDIVGGEDIRENTEVIPIQGSGYVEELVEIEGQWAYIVAPAYIDTDNLPTLVIYNHGSITFVEEDMDDTFKSNLLEYGEPFTENNYIFAVSNAHGVNWGNSESIQDNYNMYQYIMLNYGIQETVYMIGFSMGGLPTMNFASTYPELVRKLALLAPTTRTGEWDSDRVRKIMDMDIKIWHGTNDVNVGYSNTLGLVNKIESLGKDIELVTLEGLTHWDVDTEYVTDILEFFNS